MSANNSQLIDESWIKWINDKDEHAANTLIQHYMYLVNFHVERIYSHTPNSVSKDNLKSDALLGLYDALNKFETSRNLKFDTYASIRVRGAIIDGLRKEDWLPRTLRDQIKQIEQTSKDLEQRLHRNPTSQEVAKELNKTADEVETIIKDSLYANVLSIDDKPTNDSNSDGIGYTVPDDTFISPDESVIAGELKQELVEGIKQLDENEQIVVSLFYANELTLTEIGQVLDLTTSRISQIHKKAIFKLKGILSKLKTSN